MKETLRAAQYVVSNASSPREIGELLSAAKNVWQSFYRFALPAIVFHANYAAIPGTVVGHISCETSIPQICNITLDPSYYQYDIVMEHEVGHAYYFELAKDPVATRVLPMSSPSNAVFVDSHWTNLAKDVMAAIIRENPTYSEPTILALAPTIADTFLCGDDASLCRPAEICHRKIAHAPALCTSIDPLYDYKHPRMHSLQERGDVIIFVLLVIILGWFGFLCVTILKTAKVQQPVSL